MSTHRPPARSRFHLRVLTGGRTEPAAPGEDGRAEGARHVLVVDDDSLSRGLYETVLRRLVGDGDALQVHAFGDPEQALAFARLHPVELAVVDLHLGTVKMPGLALLERLRSESPAGDRLSAILVTADTEPMVVYEATRQGVSLVLEKAVDLHRFMLRCAALLDIAPQA
jgi:CheY-like chemotaxis protein